MWRHELSAMLQVLGQVSTWATSQSYEPGAVNGFLQVADYYLVAFALAHGHTVVTHEVASNSPKRIKIPDACIAGRAHRVRALHCWPQSRRDSCTAHREARACGCKYATSLRKSVARV